jgi:ribosome-associated heat shock protein Hsp15
MTAAVGNVPGQRLDVWLWHARITKSRTLAQALIEKGKVRVNRDRIVKAAHTLRLGDAVTISLGPRVRILKVQSFGARRGPAREAATLYHDLTPEQDRTKSQAGTSADSANDVMANIPQAVREQGAGRPTKRDRRVLQRLKGRLI